MAELHIVITDLLEDEKCELTGKTGEAVSVQLAQDQPASVVGLNSLLQLIRFTASQQSKLGCVGTDVGVASETASDRGSRNTAARGRSSEK